MYLVSACLVGLKCRYDGNDNTDLKVVELINQGKAIPICPEQLGGLPTPRVACEIIQGQENKIKVVNKDGVEQTQAFILGAKRSVDIAKVLKIKEAILKAKSPSCGCGKVYDGTFQQKLIAGNGLTAQALLDIGLCVYTEENFEDKLGRAIKKCE